MCGDEGTQSSPYTLFIKNNPPEGQTCKQYFETSGIWNDTAYRVANSDAIICGANITPDTSSGIYNSSAEVKVMTGNYWSNLEFNSHSAYDRYFTENDSNWYRYGYRPSAIKSLCVGD